MECFSYKGWCGMMHIEAELALATYKQLGVISNIMLFKAVIPVVRD